MNYLSPGGNASSTWSREGGISYTLPDTYSVVSDGTVVRYDYQVALAPTNDREVRYEAYAIMAQRPEVGMIIFTIKRKDISHSAAGVAFNIQ